MGTPTTDEVIRAFEEKRAAHVGAMDNLMTTAAEAGSTLDEQQSEQYDTYAEEVKSIDTHLSRLRAHEAIQKAKATPITQEAGASAEKAAAARGGEPIFVRPNLPKAWNFARYVAALAASHGNRTDAAEFVKQRWGEESRIVERTLRSQLSAPDLEILAKAAVLAGTAVHATWAGPLVEWQTIAGEFIDLLRPATVIGRIVNPSLRRVPFNIRLAGKTTGSTVGWVGEGAVKPVSALAFSETTLAWAKAAGIVVITEELARFSSPGAEDTIIADLRDTMVQFLDTQFLDPAVAAVTNVNPASVTNGVVKIGLNAAASVATWSTAIAAAIDAMSVAHITPTHWITTPTLALNLGMLRTSQDIFAFPGLTASGGTLMGLPVITSTASPAGLLILICAPEIFLADDGGVNIDTSREASVMMDSAAVVGTTAVTSLWQQNLVGIRAERFINWAKRRTAAVQVIDSTDIT
jgi:HK97 family phage major capsid protein